MDTRRVARTCSAPVSVEPKASTANDLVRSESAFKRVMAKNFGRRKSRSASRAKPHGGPCGRRQAVDRPAGCFASRKPLQMLPIREALANTRQLAVDAFHRIATITRADPAPSASVAPRSRPSFSYVLEEQLSFGRVGRRDDTIDGGQQNDFY